MYNFLSKPDTITKEISKESKDDKFFTETMVGVSTIRFPTSGFSLSWGSLSARKVTPINVISARTVLAVNYSLNKENKQTR